jgi:ribosomal-protein-alanine N-acetyltransferase
MSETDLTLRYMYPADIAPVLSIDAASFSTPWPERSYRFELQESNVSYMLVLERQGEYPVSGLRRWLKTLVRSDNGKTATGRMIVGYGGLWKIAEEAHISTIATHPDFRGRKYGEIMLGGMLRRAIALKAAYVVLEVRVSNSIAQNLYRKYGFAIHGIKENYYHYDHEDAYDMRLELNRQTIERVNPLYKRIQQKVPFDDLYSQTPHPRLRR